MVHLHFPLSVLVQDPFHSVDRFQNLVNLGPNTLIVYVDVSNLVISHRESPTSPAIELFQTQLVLDRYPSLLPENAIQMDRPVDIADPVF